MISVADAEDGSGGLFIPRTSFDLQYPRNPVNSWTSLLKGPLSTRGWAFQEHQLSPRIVHFTKPRILWSAAHALHLKASHLKYTVVSLAVEIWSLTGESGIGCRKTNRHMAIV